MFIPYLYLFSYQLLLTCPGWIPASRQNTQRKSSLHSTAGPQDRKDQAPLKLDRSSWKRPLTAWNLHWWCWGAGTRLTALQALVTGQPGWLYTRWWPRITRSMSRTHRTRFQDPIPGPGPGPQAGPGPWPAFTPQENFVLIWAVITRHKWEHFLCPSVGPHQWIFHTTISPLCLI